MIEIKLIGNEAISDTLSSDDVKYILESNSKESLDLKDVINDVNYIMNGYGRMQKPITRKSYATGNKYIVKPRLKLELDLNGNIIGCETKCV